MSIHNASYIQRAFRGRNDDGSETAATWIAAENAGWTQEGNGLFRVRFGVRQDTSNADANLSKQFKLKFSHEGGAFVDVGAQGATGIAVRYGDSTHLTDDEVTTEQLLIGDTFVAGRVIEVAPTGTITFPSGQRSLTEIEAVVEIVAAEVATDDTIVLRVYESDDTALSTYEQEPTITIGVAAPSIVTFAGTSSTASDGSGSLARDASLSGASQTETAGSGGLTVESPPSDVLLSGTSATETAGSGALARTAGLAGTSATSTAGSGSLTVTAAGPHYLIFRRTPQTGAPFDPEVDEPIATTTALEHTDEGVEDGDYDYQVFATDGETFSAGSNIEQVTVSAEPDVLLAGTSSTQTAGSGALARDVTLSGTSATEAAGSGAVSRTVAFSGTSTTESAGSGAFAAERPFAGTSATATDGSGHLASLRPLAGASATETDGTGRLEVTTPGFVTFAGTSQTVTAGSGHATVDRGLAGTSATENDGAGRLTLAVAFAGTSATETAGSGGLRTTTAVPLSGTSSTVTAGSGALSAVRSLAGSSTTVTDGEGAFAVLRGLSGTSATVTDGSGPLFTVEPDDTRAIFVIPARDGLTLDVPAADGLTQIVAADAPTEVTT